ncbi:MFS transporter [Priestia megaterium]|uniref:MFS transporter n=1 Tax=Priestia megaterium TaxID=1404 RepID=UPI00194DED17|nr:MFS transporter [Priestia megaterium]MBM6602220.1 MFS transporter [Priestia megaterium]MCA4157580.1 MFS transporter [Priestia megaterium]MDR0132509.1 MFS transporter [Priestia megaterium]MDR7206833.1 DHA1 family putative efflux transporter-like MFS transporter [Priestia megaterium]MED3861258.1 MFS transporter [Priestia megaterium]
MNNSWKIYMLTLISFVVGTSQFVIVGTLDKVAASVDVSVATAGQLITVFALGNAIGTPLVMVATSKMDQRKQLVLALAIILLGIIGVIALPGFGLLMASRVLLGIGTGVFVVTAYGIAAKLAAPGRQGGAMANVAMGYSSSLVFGVPLGRMIASSYDWKVIFWGIGLFSLLAIFAVVRTIPVMEGEAAVSLGKRLALLKNPRVALTLSVTFFVFISYSMLNTYITPFLTAVLPTIKEKLSMILLAMGIASLIGSKVGGLLADRIGIIRTLVGSMAVHIISLVLLSTVSGLGWVMVTLLLLMIWEIAAWTFGPTQNFNLVSLTPEASSIVLSLNSSFVQLGFAAGAGIGGIVAGRSSILEISWIGATSVVIALLVGVFSFRRSRELSSAQQ